MFYSGRPKIRIQPTPSDKIIEAIGWCIVIAMWCIVIINYSELPDTIPIHYNATGQVDGYGDKSMIWVLLIIGSVMYAGMFFLSKVPHVFNYPVKITEENALSEYTVATKMIRYLNLIIVMIIGYLVIITVRIALEMR